MRRRLSRVSHMIHPHHGSAPSCFCIAQEHHTYSNTLVDLEPVLHIRLTLSPVALTILAFSFGGIAAGSFLAPEFLISNDWYVECRFWYAVCTWYAESRYVGCRLWYAVCLWYAGFGMLSASCMQDFLLHFCEYTPLNAEIFLFV